MRFHLMVVSVSVFILFLSYYFTKWLIRYLKGKGLLDHPNQRSSHIIPTPRGGGIAIIASFLVGIALLKLLSPSIPLPGKLFFIGLLTVALTSFLDDKLTIPPFIRFILQALAASLVIYETEGFHHFPLPGPFNLELGWLGIPLTLFWVLAVMNIYNFLDGIDGFAGAQAILAGIGISLLDFHGAGFPIGLLIVAAAFGFLCFNWNPAKIFLGDTGSISLGFIFSTIPLYFTTVTPHLGQFSLIIFLWFFLSDGAYTIIRRLINKEKIWKPHRSHLYQRLVIAQISHGTVVAVLMALTLFLIFLTLAFYYFFQQYLIIVFILAVLLFVIYAWFVKLIGNKKRPKNIAQS